MGMRQLKGSLTKIMHRNLESAFFLTHKLVTHEKNQYDAIWLFKRFSDKRNRLTMNRAL
jgi:cytochrome c1